MTKTASTRKVESNRGKENGTVKKKDKEPLSFSKAQFLSKKAAEKKKNPQEKMVQHFPTINKPNRITTEKNFQGFRLAECVHEEEIGEFVYRPPCHRTMTKENMPGPRQEWRLCQNCLLRPCIVQGKWDEIMSICEDVAVDQDMSNESMFDKMLDQVESILVMVFGQRYVNKTPTPMCVCGIISRFIDMKRGMEEDDETDQPDDDLVAGAIDGADFLILQS